MLNSGDSWHLIITTLVMPSALGICCCLLRVGGKSKDTALAMSSEKIPQIMYDLIVPHLPPRQNTTPEPGLTAVTNSPYCPHTFHVVQYEGHLSALCSPFWRPVELHPLQMPSHPSVWMKWSAVTVCRCRAERTSWWGPATNDTTQWKCLWCQKTLNCSSMAYVVTFTFSGRSNQSFTCFPS